MKITRISLPSPNLKWLLLLALLPASFAVFAHTINYDMAKLSQMDVGVAYIKLGFTHILPYGFDHVLFVLSLYFLSPKLSTVLWQATAFTVAHSITLGLAMYGYIQPLPAIIEPIIALSIFFVAVENLLVKELKPGRIAIVFLFGLVHGMGFASALTGLGLPPSGYLVSLLSFNVGVELGQITVILTAWMLAGRWFSDKPWYRSRVVNPVSMAIALVALYWTMERTFG
ncbi:HupE/UreJ family protein [Runella sp.]|uniref:HupE/UreJ family protein n=1 Tax=Runella sp. TaxID=1960881 RepID=UPI00301B371D